MEKYEYSKIEADVLKQSVVPFAVYQFIDKRVVTVLLSKGFLELFGYDDYDNAVFMMDNDMYTDVHPDDVARIADDAVRFATGKAGYNTVYRSKKHNGNDDEYEVIHSFGKHEQKENGVTLATVWYVSEGKYDPQNSGSFDVLTGKLSRSLYESSNQRKNNFDFLTGLSNMNHFFELVTLSKNRVHAEGNHCSLVYANITGMKYFNRKYGFASGDEILRNLGDFLSLRFGSENCCRIGQDNFAAISLSDDVFQKAETLIADFEMLGYSGIISLRIGIYPDTMGTVETSVACDRARYACNTLKKGRKSAYTVFDEKMLEYETRKQYVVNNLDKAIEEGWIQAYYQPIVRAANGRVSDEEALARWIDPVKGMLSPADFIPILEDTKLIYKLDLCMVDLIIEKMKILERGGLYIVPNSVNLSRTDFDACDMVNEICKRVDAAGLSRDLLTIEITESVVGSDFDFIKEQVERFQKLGFHVWMDDFGSGYSSLDVLQSIHFDLIKFDMRFMKQFDNGDKSRIILTELMRMALGLGIESVCEGVEREDQVEFLCEIGCTKLQGYHYCKPIPRDTIIERYRTGTQIGFENPRESKYFEAIGRINLYDTVAVAKDDSTDVAQFFDTFPTAVAESDISGMKIIRCNKSYRDFSEKYFGTSVTGVTITYEAMRRGSAALLDALKQCMAGKDKVFFYERIDNSSTVYNLVRRIAQNPVKGVVACAIVILGVVKESGQTITYADIANSLSSDYIYLYYVNIETEDYVEYRSDPNSVNLAVERHGTDFFESSLKDAEEAIYKDDRKRFTTSFTRENVLESIDKNGMFTINYRLLMDGNPVYVSMKAVRMGNDPTHLIIGVNNVDAHMRQQEAFERMQEEQVTYARIVAISGNYICIYTVNPETGDYTEFNASSDYEGLGLMKSGTGFFEKAAEESKRTLYEEDVEMFNSRFSKEKVMQEIKENGVFMLNYRLVIDGKPTYVCLKAALVEEKDGPKLVIGVNNIDPQVRRELENRT